LVEKEFVINQHILSLVKIWEDLLRPALIGVVVVFLSTLFWLIQSNPTHEPSFPHVVGFTQAGNNTLVKGF
jgi:hypothetical protein